MEDLAQDGFMFADSPDLPPASRPPSGLTPEQDYSISSDGPRNANKVMPANWMSDEGDACLP